MLEFRRDWQLARDLAPEEPKHIGITPDDLGNSEVTRSVQRNDPLPVRRARNILWRSFDIVGALALLFLFLPLIVIISCAILVDDPGTLIFRHRRIGRGGRHFECLKFRTMRVHGSASFYEYLRCHPELLEEWGDSFKLRKDPRITRVGRPLRKLSLDELPQLFNVLRGEMSLVGPRPIVDDEVARYGEYFTDYCSVRPGLTGLWQVSGRNDATYEQRVALDCEYIRNKSVPLDLFIMVKTVPAVLVSRGAY